MLLFFCPFSRVRTTQRFHLEVGANFVLKRQLSARYGCGTSNVTCALFEPQPRFLNESTRKASELGANTFYVPFAAWIENTSLDLYLHHDKLGVGSSIYRSSVFVKSAAKINREKQLLEKVRVPAIDLAEWMATHVPPSVHMTAHIDVEVTLIAAGIDPDINHAIVLPCVHLILRAQSTSSCATLSCAARPADLIRCVA